MSARAKRAFDLAGVAAGGCLLWPVFAAVALLIAVEDGRPVFFRQQRIGRGGRPFRIWKFRTMAGGRVTPVGRWLRRTKLDELPQLLNVLRGEMSLVGPRPELERYVALYDREQRRVLDVLPGITDPASLQMVAEDELLAGAEDPEAAYVHTILPAKIRLSLAYAARATVRSDLRVVLRTLAAVAGRWENATGAPAQRRPEG
ncbi:MAG TPA: sugar transferase [Longimicrobium sp.]|nr:sugar transferase [Longimicrobium sp.]